MTGSPGARREGLASTAGRGVPVRPARGARPSGRFLTIECKLYKAASATRARLRSPASSRRRPPSPSAPGPPGPAQEPSGDLPRPLAGAAAGGQPQRAHGEDPHDQVDAAAAGGQEPPRRAAHTLRGAVGRRPAAGAPRPCASGPRTASKRLAEARPAAEQACRLRSAGDGAALRLPHGARAAQMQGPRGNQRSCRSCCSRLAAFGGIL